MVKVNIISGFLGAGKTTLIKKLLGEVYAGEKIAIIENEFGEIGIDGGLLKESGIEIKEMNSGCICCSLVGDFSASLKEMTEKYKPDRIIIEPTGVGKLSDVVNAVKSADEAELAAFADSENISGWALGSMKWAVANKLLNGTDNKELKPLDSATRAEVAAIFMRYIENVLK